MDEIHRLSLEHDGGIISDKNGWLVDYDDHVDYVVEVTLAERKRCADIVSSLHIGRADHDCYSDYECGKITSAEKQIKNGISTSALDKSIATVVAYKQQKEKDE